MERALVQARKIMEVMVDGSTLVTQDIWDSPIAQAATYMLFIIWEPPPPSFLKVNFDGSIRGSRGDATFVIRGPNSRLIATSGCHL